MTAWPLIRDGLLLLALGPFVYYLIAIFAALRFFSILPPIPSDFRPPVSVLKPIRGLDRETYENYASFCAQEYPDFEVLFCVSDAEDPAIPVIERLIRDFPGRSIRLLIGSEPLGVSDKVNKLCRMVREARHEMIVVSDSDVRVQPDFLRTVTAPFQDPKIGGVTCLYRGLTDGSLPADLEALGNSTDFAPGVLTAWLFGDLDFMLGAVMVTSKSRLAEIGGFESIVNHFCDDYELGNRIAARDHRIQLSHVPVAVVYPAETLADAFRHQLRWNLSIRYSRPWGHFGLLFAQCLPWSILAASIAPTPKLSVAYLAVYAFLRLALAWIVAIWGMQDKLPWRKAWLLPLRDLFAFVVWLASYFPQRIHWRDQEFYVRDKQLVPIATRHS
jgi:ceramide glucosyltransferase